MVLSASVRRALPLALIARISLGLVLAVLGASAVGRAAEQQTAVPRPTPTASSTYNEVYEACLAGYAGTGIGRNVGPLVIVTKCRTSAERASGGEQPTPTAWTAQYQQCLLTLAADGAPRGIDVSIFCSQVATGVSGEQPPDSRYVILQKGQSNPQERPTYLDAYRNCLVMLAETGIGPKLGFGNIVQGCTDTAAQQSGTPKPDETPADDVMDLCLLTFAQKGAPKGLDIRAACTQVATPPVPTTTRQPR